ncbi:hypothetical protein BX666DRAFT_1269195 [Dichotomocladium elegans]|nr:hypothetical protein BX666DRAFT_1269195 [Dichotomocladium elegans]
MNSVSPPSTSSLTCYLLRSLAFVLEFWSLSNPSILILCMSPSPVISYARTKSPIHSTPTFVSLYLCRKPYYTFSYYSFPMLASTTALDRSSWFMFFCNCVPSGHNVRDFPTPHPFLYTSTLLQLLIRLFFSRDFFLKIVNNCATPLK